jgi:hypothetical protein
MFTKMRLYAVALAASGALLFYAQQAGACHGSYGSKGQHTYSQSSVATAAQQPASLQQQAALVAKVQRTSASLASMQQTASSTQSAVLPTLQRKQLAVQNALRTRLQRGNGRLTRSQLQTLGRQESAIVAQLRAVRAGAIK